MIEIKTKCEHTLMLEVVDLLMILDPKRGTKEFDRMVELAECIENHEKKLYPDLWVGPRGGG